MLFLKFQDKVLLSFTFVKFDLIYFSWLSPSPQLVRFLSGKPRFSHITLNQRLVDKCLAQNHSSSRLLSYWLQGDWKVLRNMSQLMLLLCKFSKNWRNYCVNSTAYFLSVNWSFVVCCSEPRRECSLSFKIVFSYLGAK